MRTNSAVKVFDLTKQDKEQELIDEMQRLNESIGLLYALLLTFHLQGANYGTTAKH